MEIIRQLIANCGPAGVPTETLLRAFNSLFNRECIAAGAFTTGGTVTPSTAATTTVAVINGQTVTIAASTATPTWTTAMSIAANSFLVVLTTVKAGGTMTNYLSNNPTSVGSLVYPVIPANEAVVGGIFLAPTVTFTGGTTLLNAANVNAVVLSAVGGLYPTNAF